MPEKTETPTPRRLRRAREEGDSGLSAYAAQSVGFFVAVAVAPAAVVALATQAGVELRLALTRASAPPGMVQFDPAQLAATVAALTLPLLITSAIAAGVAQALQSGGIVSVKRLAPRFERLDPVAGLKGIFSSTRLFAVLRSLLAATIVGWLAWDSLRAHLVDLARTAGHTRWIGTVVREAASALAWRAALVGLALGVLDVLVMRRAWMRRLRMSKEEVRREHKEAEGDPLLKAARERGHRELLAQANVASVRTASVIVVNPAHLACALRYDEQRGDQAPLVVATGEGAFAARIVDAARDHGVPVVRDAPLARALFELTPGQVIPTALYEAVAEILREAWRSLPDVPTPYG
jgi:flagellar biosynthesis protein FlhB